MAGVNPTREQLQAEFERWALQELLVIEAHPDSSYTYLWAVTEQAWRAWVSAVAFASGAASRPVPTTDSTGADVLTRDECMDLLCKHYNATERLQAAARIGAERARERAARVCEKRAETRMQDNGVYDDETGAWEYPSYAEWCLTADEEDDDCAAAIRRGEGG